MPLPDRLRLPFSFEPELLARDLRALSTVDWIQHFVRQNYEGDWSVIPLRAPVEATHPVMMIYPRPDTEQFKDTPFLARAVYIRKILQDFTCELAAVRLMRLTPGSAIKEHCDYNLGVEHDTVRLHLPVTSNPDVDFRLNGTRVLMEPGSLWYLRLSDTHSVTNNGDTDRVHLVIDARPDAWLLAMLESAATPSIQE